LSLIFFDSRSGQRLLAFWVAPLPLLIESPSTTIPPVARVVSTSMPDRK